MSKKDLLGACGLYCGACNHYLYSTNNHTQNGSEDLTEEDDFICNGCWSHNIYMHSGCYDCTIRLCCQEKQIDYCGICDEFPCEMIKKMQSDDIPHHKSIIQNSKDIKALDIEAWLEQQKVKWSCSKCGKGHSWFAITCEFCGNKITPETLIT